MKLLCCALAVTVLVAGCGLGPSRELPAAHEESPPTEQLTSAPWHDELPDPRWIALDTRDLPPGYHADRSRSGPVDNKKAAAPRRNAADHERLLEALGRMDGYQSYFEPDRDAPLAGKVLSIRSQVSTYRAIDGARGYFEYTVALPVSPTTPVDAPSVGEQSAAWTSRPGEGARATTELVVQFRSGLVVATVTLAGHDNSALVEEAVRLARIMEARASAPRPTN